MDAIHNTERQWFRIAALNLVTKKGAEHARRVAEFHRRQPMPGAHFYPRMIEQAIEAHGAAS